MKPEGKFTSYLWESIQAIYIDLIKHPFVIQLAKGTLPQQYFAHYLSQDILYIRDDSKALENLSKKATKPAEQAFFMSLAIDGIAIEQELHNHFLKSFNISEAKTKSPAIEEYSRFLIEHSKKSTYHIAAAALLPCFWVYNSIGKHILAHAAKNNAYQKWIDTYQGDEYEDYTKSFIQIVERLAITANENEKKRMQKVFAQATMFELNFFEESISK
jgi:thiaminase/transcriptional activator TenA